MTIINKQWKDVVNVQSFNLLKYKEITHARRLSIVHILLNVLIKL